MNTKTIAFLSGYLSKEASVGKGLSDLAVSGAKNVAKEIGPVGLASGASAYNMQDNSQSPLQRVLYSLLPAISGSNAMRRNMNKNLKNVDKHTGLFGQVARGAGAASALGLIDEMRGLAKGVENQEKDNNLLTNLSSGMQNFENLSNSAQDIAANVAQFTKADSTRNFTNQATTTLADLGDNLKDVKDSGVINNTAGVIKDIGGSLRETSDTAGSFIDELKNKFSPMVSTMDKYKHPLLAGSGLLTLAMAWNYMKDAEKSRKDADLVQAAIKNINNDRKIASRKERERLKLIKEYKAKGLPVPEGV